MREQLEHLLDDQSHRWSSDSRRLVEDYLADAPSLRADDEQLLDLIYHEVLLRQRCGESPELAEYVRRFPALESQLRVHFAVHEALESCDELEGDTQLYTNSSQLAASSPCPTTVARFELLRLHARGGLGEVFVARDGELPREVAFKRLQPRHARDADSRSRFVREAEITSRLEHPGIVPVYGLLRDDAGQPGYAMRLIQGEPMSEAIQRLHESTAAGDHRLALRKLLGRFVAVCHAIAYAHSQGILHRDLKPANIMLGPYGETLVIDWGLAREIAPPCDRETVQPELHSNCGNVPAETQPGELLGTPAFMSPEQAAGDWEHVGPASDIYSLGATLYMLLTGATPFAETESRKLLARVRQGDFPRPRQRRSDVPRALEAVCLRALALRPEDRYETAQQLADDIDRWLADEPVTARRTPRPEQAARWMRRHPAWAAAVAAALVVTAIAVVVLHFSHDRAREQQRISDERTRQAESLTRHQQRITAASNFHKGREKAALRDHEGAVESFKSAIVDLELLLPHEPSVRYLLAASYNNLGQVRLDVGNPESAESELRRANTEYQQVVKDEFRQGTRADHDSRLGLTTTWRKLGVMYGKQEDRANDAQHAFEQAVEALEHIDPLAVEPHKHSYYLAYAKFDYAEFSRRRGELEFAVNSLFEAVRLAERAVEWGDKDAVEECEKRALPANAIVSEYPETRRLLVKSHDRLGRIFQQMSQMDKAEVQFAAAHACRRELARKQLETAQQWLVDHSPGRARPDFEEAINLFLEIGLAELSADDRQSLATAFHGLGQVHQEAGQQHMADLAFQREREITASAK